MSTEHVRANDQGQGQCGYSVCIAPVLMKNCPGLVWFGWVDAFQRKGILAHVQEAVGARLKPLFQGNRVGSALFQTQPGIQEGSYSQFYPNTT